MTAAHTVLVADIGGTNARFALAGADGVLRHALRLPTAAYPSLADALQDYRRHVGTGDAISAACLAVAGPVANGRAALTNAHWQCDEAELETLLGAPVRLVNDFQAQAAALGVLALDDLEHIGAARPAAGVRFVLGPGTGLGGAAWLPDGAHGRVVPTEIGHVDIAPGDALEIELLGVLSTRIERVTWEHVFSGGGLVNLHAAMGQLWGASAEALLALRPEEVVALAREGQDPVAMHTLEIFANWLGGLAGNLALTFLPRGGVFLTGSIVEQLSEVLAGGGFRRRFEGRAPLEDLVRGIATARIRDLDHGLRGAAVLAAAARG